MHTPAQMLIMGLAIIVAIAIPILAIVADGVRSVKKSKSTELQRERGVYLAWWQNSVLALLALLDLAGIAALTMLIQNEFSKKASEIFAYSSGLLAFFGVVFLAGVLAIKRDSSDETRARRLRREQKRRAVEQ